MVKQIEVLTLQDFNDLMRYRINKTKQENNARQLILIVITLITGAILLMKLIKFFN